MSNLHGKSYTVGRSCPGDVTSDRTGLTAGKYGLSPREFGGQGRRRTRSRVSVTKAHPMQRIVFRSVLHCRGSGEELGIIGRMVIMQPLLMCMVLTLALAAFRVAAERGRSEFASALLPGKWL